MQNPSKMPRVLVPLAQGCEELEAITIVDLLRRAGIIVVTAGLDARPVVASRGVTLIADTTIDTVLNAHFDMVVLPGGLKGAQHLQDDPHLRNILARIRDENGHIAAICAAPRVLAAAGLLNGKRATSYPGLLDGLSLQNTTIANEPVVQDGQIITSQGPGTAMAFALTLIEVLAGRAKRDEVDAALIRR